MPLKITTLIENSQGQHRALKCEHGLSFHIEKDGRKFLFDTGQTSAFLYNAEVLQIDLTDLEYVVLSHGHYDHTGGFRTLAGLGGKFELILGKGFFDPKYGAKGGSSEFLGNSFDEGFLRQSGISYEFMSQDTLEFLPGVHLVTNFIRRHDDEQINPRFKIYENGEFRPDLFSDEVCMAVETPQGLVVVLGCSHPGVKNMLDTVSERLGKPVYAVLGGTHLMEASRDSIRMTMDYFREKDIKRIGVSHCTGQVAMDSLKACSDRFYHNRTGSSLILG